MAMRWYRKLYLGPNAAQNAARIRRKASEGKWMAGVYYITLASTEGNLFDLFHNGMLKEPLFRKSQRMDVVGVAEGRLEAVELVEKLVGELYSRTGGFDTEAYFKSEDFEEI